MLSLIALAVVAAGCGGSGGGNGEGGGVPGINVKVTSPVGTAAVDDNANQTLLITVQVTGDSKNQGVTWTLAPAQKGNPTGTITALPNTQYSATYTPPDIQNAPVQVVVMATSISDPTRSATIPVTVYPTLAVDIQSSPLTTAFLNKDYNCLRFDPNAGVLQNPCIVNSTGGLGPYTWSLGATLLPDGLQLSPDPLNQASIEITGQPTTMGIFPFSLTVTDSLGVSATALFSISVAPTQLKVTTPTVLSTEPGTPYAPIQLQASGGTPPYTWSLVPGSAFPPKMTLSPAGAISGTPDGVTYHFAVQVVDSQSPVPAQAIFPSAQSNPNIMTLGPSGLPPDCSGGPSVQAGTPYAFLFTGFDADGPVTISGSFTADNAGHLTGVEDIVRANATQTGVALTTGSAIGFDSTLRHGCLVLNTSTTSIQFRAAPTTIASGGNGQFYSAGRIVEFDDGNGQGTRGTGFFRMQDPTAFSTSAIAGSYAFRFSGWNSNAGHFAMAGTAAAANGLLASVAADANDAGTLSGALTGGSGTVSSVDATSGRGTATLNIGVASYDLIFYVIDAQHLIFNSPQPATAGHPLITGEATASVGPFSLATLSNSHIYRFGGSIPGTPDVGVGVLHFDGAGSLAGTSFERNGGTATANTLSGQYTVDPASGRFTFSGTAIPAIGYAIPAASGVTGYLVGTGASAASGVMEFQTDKYPPGYQFSPLNNRYGFAVDEPLDPQTLAFVGQEQVRPDGNLDPSGSSFLDSSGPAPFALLPMQSFFLFHYTWNADGSGTYGGETYMVTNGAKIFYIDTSPLNAHPAVIVGEGLQ